MKKIIFILVIVIGTSAFGIYGQTKNDDIIKLAIGQKWEKNSARTLLMS